MSEAMSQPATETVVASDGTVLTGVTPASVPTPTSVLNAPPAPAPQPQFRGITEDELNDRLARARQQEKDKLYPQLEELKKSVQELSAEREARVKAEQAAEEARLAAEKAEAEKQMNAKQLVEERTRELQEQLNKLAEERERDRLLLERERDFNELMNYRTSRLSEEDENIMPELRDYISGNTREEIDAAIARAKQTTQSILEQVTASQQAARRAMPGVSPTGLAPIGPLDNEPGQESLSLDDIRGMDINTYAKYRDKLLGLDRSRRTDRGLYG